LAVGSTGGSSHGQDGPEGIDVAAGAVGPARALFVAVMSVVGVTDGETSGPLLEPVGSGVGWWIGGCAGA
jgi:hypothetical protein